MIKKLIKKLFFNSDMNDDKEQAISDYLKIYELIKESETVDRLQSIKELVVMYGRTYTYTDLFYTLCVAFDIRHWAIRDELMKDALNYESLGNDMQESGHYDIAELLYSEGLNKIKDYKREL